MKKLNILDLKAMTSKINFDDADYAELKGVKNVLTHHRYFTSILTNDDFVTLEFSKSYITENKKRYTVLHVATYTEKEEATRSIPEEKEFYELIKNEKINFSKDSVLKIVNKISKIKYNVIKIVEVLR